MYTEALDPPLGVRFLYKLRSNTTYIESQNTLNDGVDQNYKENERATKPTGVHLKKLGQGYMNEQKGVEEDHLAQ